jgi:hypothetical protein
MLNNPVAEGGSSKESVIKKWLHVMRKICKGNKQANKRKLPIGNVCLFLPFHKLQNKKVFQDRKCFIIVLLICIYIWCSISHQWTIMIWTNPFPTDLLVSLDSCTAQLVLLIPDYSLVNNSQPYTCNPSQGFSSSLIDGLAFCSSVFLISFLSLTYIYACKGFEMVAFIPWIEERKSSPSYCLSIK